jgi:hypothetical protein
MSTLTKGTVVKLKNSNLKKTLNTKVKHVPYHWHVVLEETETKVLLLPLSSKPLSKYPVNKTLNESTNWHLEVDPQTNTYNCPNQMKWVVKSDPWLKDQGDSYSLSESEWDSCMDCLYDDLYNNVSTNKYYQPSWLQSKQEMMKYYKW